MIARAVHAVALAWIASGCGSSKTECDCIDSAIYVHVPSTRAADVEGLAAAGAACARSSPSCVARGPNATGCATYRVVPTAAGSCELTLTFSQGAPQFQASLAIVNGSSCCGGFYADPPSAADVEVPG